VEIDLSYDSSANSAPAGFKTAMAYAAQVLDHLIVNNITVNINVGWGEDDGSPVSPGSGEGGPQGTDISYTQLVSELTTNATSPADHEAVANLPATNPTNGGVFLVSNALQKAWGMMPADGTENDGSVGFGVDSSAYPYDFSTNGTIISGDLDFVGIAEHELTHALGRLAGLQQYVTNEYAPQDLFRYATAGVLELRAGSPAYFSIDGGRTNLDNFDRFSDPGDWASTTGPDSFDAFSVTGVESPITAVDITEMDVLGFTVACFAAGTRIATTRGQIAVESLRVGDRVVTASGDETAVKWLGRRRLACRRHPRPQDVWPVRVQADAFGPGRPVRDLLLSPDHAVFVRGALIPIRYLINGASIAQEACDAIEYWHVELPQHDVLLAENLAAESYLDTGNRATFNGTGPAVVLYPDFARRVWQQAGCAPLLLGGRPVRAEHRRLLARAAILGYAITDDPAIDIFAGSRKVTPARNAARITVRLPPGAESVRFRSRTWTPAHVDPSSDDARSLGIAVGRLWLDGREASLASPALGWGWHDPEPEWRWTLGDASLSVVGVRELSFELAMAGRYWEPGRPSRLRSALDRR
jgi:hypothetical protein